ncbi:MAG: hypothetical protein ACRCT8_13100 [Lacipirellulaceae bacterium]
MDAQRNDPAPTWLVLLAVAAFSLSWFVAHEGVRSLDERQWRPASPTVAGGGVIRWPVLSLGPIEAPAPLAEYAPRSLSRLAELAHGLRIDPAVLSGDHATDPLRRLSAADLMAPYPRIETPLAGISRVEAMFAAAPAQQLGLLVLVPSEPRWSAELAAVLPVIEASPSQAVRSADYASELVAQGARRLGALVAPTKPQPLVVLDVVATATRDAAIGIVDGYANLLSDESTRRFVARPTPRNGRFTKVGMMRVSEYLAAGTASGAYPAATKLGEQLDVIAASPESAGWAWAVAYQLRGLAGLGASDVAAVRLTLERLAAEATEGLRMADDVASPALAAELRRAHHALVRRGDAWGAELDRRVAVAQVEAGRALVAEQLEAMRWAMSSDGWALAPLGAGHSFGARRLPASDAASTLPLALPKPLKLAQRLEQYEAGPSGAAGRVILEEARQLAAGSLPAEREVGELVERDYRNANLRVAIAADLVNRLLPTSEPQRGVVRDTIAGAPVRGWSTTQTRLAVKLTPDERAWRLALEARGDVQSDTYSRGGPAVVRSRGVSQFVAQKPLVLDYEGIDAQGASAQATSSSRLAGLSSSYDRVPLVGSYVRRVARDRYSQVRSRAAAESRVKVERQVARTLDERVGPELTRLESRWNDDVVARATSLGLELQPVELRTTDTRLIARLRVAGSEQLAAHTPRMRAPSDSVLSVQLHESSVNNAVEGLGLAGQRLTARQLRERLAERLAIKATENHAEDGAIVRFADADPVRVTFDGGRVELTLSLREMVVRGAAHHDFKVHAFYRPAVSGLRPALVQEGAPQIEGRLRTGARLRLHAVWGKVLGEDRRLELLAADRTPTGVASKLDGLVVSQFVIEDGWMGLAVTPRRHASIAAQVGTYAR